MKAVVLAAGDGARLGPITQHLPKAMLPIGSETVIARLLRQLVGAGISEVCIVVGYQADRLCGHLSVVASQLGIEPTLVDNDAYDTTNTAYSASLTAPWVDEEAFLLIDGDIVVTDRVITKMAERPECTIAYERKPITGPEEMKLEVDSGEQPEVAVRLGKQIDAGIAGECIGITALDQLATKRFFAALDGLSATELEESYYEVALDAVAAEMPITTLRVHHAEWTEIDFVTDYLEAASRFGGGSAAVAPSVSEQVLLCPGPVRVSPQVRRALQHADIGHREYEFVEILTRTRQKLLRVFGVGASPEYTDVILTGSGTAANEALISSYLSGKRVAVLSNGEFGERLAALCRCHQIDVSGLDFGWGGSYRLEEINQLLSTQQVEALIMVHHETSTGMLNPVLAVGELCRRYGVKLCVDAISSLGAEPLHLEEADVAFCTGCASKAVGSLPGLAFVCGKKSEFAALAGQPTHSYYLDLFRYYQFEEKQYQTPNTPAVSLFFALEAALDELLSETVPSRMRHYDELSSIVRARFAALGWPLVLPVEAMSRVLTTVYYPEWIDVEGFHRWIRQQNYVVYRGKGPLAGRAFQVANIGWLSRTEIEHFMELVETYAGTLGPPHGTLVAR